VVLAATGAAEVEVYRRPRVAILSTGDELVTPIAPGNQDRSWVNQYALAAFVTQAGNLSHVWLGIVPNDHKIDCCDVQSDQVQFLSSLLAGVSVSTTMTM
jgi:molybdopterin biosynthesis enzyme